HPMPLANPIHIPAGETVAIYLHGTVCQLRYREVQLGETASNEDLVVESQHTRVLSIPFEGSIFSPRGFAGIIYYEMIPLSSFEPGVQFASVGIQLLSCSLLTGCRVYRW